MSNIQQLSDYIRLYKYITYDEVENKAFDINANWRESSWTRALRKVKDIIAIPKDKTKKPNGHNPIVAYEHKVKPETFNEKKELETLQMFKDYKFTKKSFHDYV